MPETVITQRLTETMPPDKGDEKKLKISCPPAVKITAVKIKK